MAPIYIYDWLSSSLFNDVSGILCSWVNAEMAASISEVAIKSCSMKQNRTIINLELNEKLVGRGKKRKKNQSPELFGELMHTVQHVPGRITKVTQTQDRNSGRGGRKQAQLCK